MYCVLDFSLYVYLVLPLCLSIDFLLLPCSEYLGCFEVLFEDYLEEDCRSSLLELAGLYFLHLPGSLFLLIPHCYKYGVCRVN
jgi:hypothetical protein